MVTEKLYLATSTVFAVQGRESGSSTLSPDYYMASLLNARRLARSPGRGLACRFSP